MLLGEKLHSIVAQIPPTIMQMAQKEVHQVIFTSSYYSDLQLIETVRVSVKGEVGQQYKTDTKFKDVLVSQAVLRRFVMRNN